MDDKRISEIKTEFFNSKVKPLERKETKAYHTATNEVCSVLSTLSANSFVGRLEPDVYEPSIKAETSIDVFKAHLTIILSEYVERRRTNSEFTEVWIEVTAETIRGNVEGLIEEIDGTLKRYHLEELKSKICVALNNKVLWEDAERLVELNKLKEYGVKVAITGVGERLCPLQVLNEIKGNYVSLSSKLEMSEEESVKQAVHSLIEYLKTMGYVVYAECKEDEKSLYRRFGVNACWVV